MTVTPALLRQLRGMKICPENIILTLDVDGSLLLASKPQTNIITPTTGRPRPLMDRSLLVQSLIMVGGPRADGVTTNANQLFVGGNSNTLLADGWPLVPGATLWLDAVNLQDVYVLAVDPLDRLRILFIA